MLSWDASSVPGGGFVTGYAIFVDGEQVATTTSTSYRVTGLSADTDYQFSVAAIDAAGSSAQTSPISVHTTLPLPDADDGHMFSPYIDMAMSNAADLAGISAASGITNFTLAFVLASNEGIGWQGWGSIDDDTLFNGTTILQHVQDIQAAGGNITISFGGAAGTEAALVATSAAQLQAQYQSVIDRYGIDSIDFDIEGAAVQNQNSLVLRLRAVNKWVALAKVGGLRALKSRRRGRRPGSGRLTSGQSARIRGLIVSKMPDQLKLPFYLWTRAGVATLIEREYGMAVSLTTVGRYLRAWGMTPQKPARRAYERNDSAIKRWLVAGVSGAGR